MITRLQDIPIAEIVTASQRREITEAMRCFYADLEYRIAAHQPACQCCGQCCQFHRYGHRLFGTSLELCYYLSAGLPCPPLQVNACPYLLEQKCQIRDYRLLGCRIFHCQPHAQEWQSELMEFALRRLRTMHEQFEVPYVYADWMDLLRACQTI